MSPVWYSISFFADFNPETEGESFTARIQGAEILAKNSRQHGNDSVNQVNRSSSFPSFIINICSLLAKVAGICNVNSELIVVAIWGEWKGVIKVSGVVRVDSENSPFPQVLSSSYFLFGDLVLSLAVHMWDKFVEILMNFAIIMLHVLDSISSKQGRCFCLDISEFPKNADNSALRVLTFGIPSCKLSSKIMALHICLDIFANWFCWDIHCRNSAVVGVEDELSFRPDVVDAADNLPFLGNYVYYFTEGTILLLFDNFKIYFVVVKGSVSVFAFHY